MAVASDGRERIEVVFGRLASVDLAAASFADCERALADAVRIERWTAAVKAKAALARARRLRERPQPEPRPEPAGAAEPQPTPTPPTGRSTKEDARATAVRRTIEMLASFGDALGEGALTEEHLVVVDRSRTRRERLAAAEAELLAAAIGRTAEDFEVWLKRWNADRDASEGISAAARQRAKRTVSMFPGEDGMGELRATLQPADFDAMKRSLRDLDRRLELAGRIDPTAGWNQRMADALVEMMHRSNSLDSGTVEAAGGSLRTAVVVFIDYHDLIHGLGHGVTVDGQPVDVHEVRRMAADAFLIPMLLGRDGEVLDMGRAQRYGSDAHWLAAVAEQGGCWRDGCVNPVGALDVHHLRPWDDGGGTDHRNLAVGCRTHHREHHASGATMRKVGGRIHITSRDGTTTIAPTRRDRTPPRPPPDD